MPLDIHYRYCATHYRQEADGLPKGFNKPAIITHWAMVQDPYCEHPDHVHARFEQRNGRTYDRQQERYLSDQEVLDFLNGLDATALGWKQVAEKRQKAQGQ